MKSYEMEAPLRYLKKTCGKPPRGPRGVDVEIIWQDHELGSYPVIAVVWDDYVTSYPHEYIEKCMVAYEHFELTEEIHERGRLLSEIHNQMEKVPGVHL